MKLKHYRYSKISIFSLIVGVLYISVVNPLFAAYVPLVGIPGISGTPSLPDYINKVYMLTIAVGVLIAIMRIAFAGVKYSMSGVVTDKASAKSDIRGVLLGLAILLLPALVLNTINPDLLKLDVLNGVPKINLQTGGGSVTNTQTITPGSVVQTGDASKTLQENINACKGTYNPATNVCYVYQPIGG